MKRRTSTVGLVAQALMMMLFVGVIAAGSRLSLRGTVDTTVQREDDHPILAPCSRYEDRYKDKAKFNGEYLKDWEDKYHDTVNDVLEEHMEMPELTCDAEDYEELLKAGEKLTALAESLPTWQDDEVRLTRYDLGRVLLEYLRVYECALDEYEQTISRGRRRKKSDGKKTKVVARPDPDPELRKIFINMNAPELLTEDGERVQMIQREKIVARETLTRALGIVSALDRLRPLEMELQCMQRISLDIRNITSLAAEASACLPRTWNGKDILRDVK